MSHLGGTDAAARQRDSLGLCGEGLGAHPAKGAVRQRGARQGRGHAKTCYSLLRFEAVG
jgi:hypothetical protein